MIKFNTLGSLSLLVTSFLLLLSCSKDDDVKKTAPAGSIIATVDSKAWKSETAVGLINNGTIAITGSAIDKSQVVLLIKGTKTGKYTISALPSSTTLPENVGSFTPPNASLSNPTYASTNVVEVSAGEVVITEIDEKNSTISGTFSIKVARTIPSAHSIEIKEGSFTKIAYTSKVSNVPNNLFSAKVDGVNFSVAQAAATSSFGKIIINANDSGGETLSLSVPANIATGIFDLGGMTTNYSAMYIDGVTTYESSSGKLQISKHDKTAKRIEGTFNFKGQIFPTGGGNLSVTNGSFAVTY
jgi:hypothetical protein